jgi:hypothetical protein
VGAQRSNFHGVVKYLKPLGSQGGFDRRKAPEREVRLLVKAIEISSVVQSNEASVLGAAGFGLGGARVDALRR